MTTTAIKNATRTMLVLNLTRDIAPRRMMLERVVSHRDGTHERKNVRVVVGDSIHLRAGETKRGFSNAVRRCSDVINAVRAGHIVLTEEADEPKAVAPEEPKAGGEWVAPEPNEHAREAAPAAPIASKPGGSGKKSKG